MTNKPPRFIWKWCWKIISPVTIFLVLSMSIKSMSETTPQYSVWDASKVLVLPYKLSHFQRYKPYYQRNETYLKAYLDYFSYDPHQSNDKCPSDPQGVTDLKAKVHSLKRSRKTLVTIVRFHDGFRKWCEFSTLSLMIFSFKFLKFETSLC